MISKTLQYFKSSRTDMTRIVSDLYDGKISVDDLVLGSELLNPVIAKEVI